MLTIQLRKSRWPHGEIALGMVHYARQNRQPDAKESDPAASVQQKVLVLQGFPSLLDIGLWPTTPPVLGPGGMTKRGT